MSFSFHPEAENELNKAIDYYEEIEHGLRYDFAGEVYLRYYGGDLFEVESAGLEPGTLNPYVVEVLKEDGIDISGKQTRKVWDLYKAGNIYSYVIAVCSREAEEKCPIFPGVTHRISWPFPDPKKFTGGEEDILRKTREVRDVIKEMILQFIESYKNKRKPPEYDT